MTGFITFPAYVPRHVIAHSPTGEWAELITSDYLVRWYGADGSLKHFISGAVEPGPRLTAEQRAFQSRLIERRGRLHGFEPAERLQPLRSLNFDTRGRLWIQHQIQGGRSRVDVWRPDGTYDGSVWWPEGIRMESAFIREQDAHAIRRDTTGVMRVVRIIFHDRLSETGGE